MQKKIVYSKVTSLCFNSVILLHPFLFPSRENIIWTQYIWSFGKWYFGDALAIFVSFDWSDV